MKRMFVHSAVLLTGVASVVVAAGQQPQTRQVIDVQKIADNYYVLTSSRPVTHSGVVLVDTKLAAWGQTLLDRGRESLRESKWQS